jgi:hypothetical protein
VEAEPLRLHNVEAEFLTVHLRITMPMLELLLELKRATGLDQAGVFLRAIALLKMVVDAEDEGLFPALIDANGELKARLTGIKEISK